MTTRFNPLALVLGIFVVLILGSAIFTMSARRPSDRQFMHQEVFTHDRVEAEPPSFATPLSRVGPHSPEIPIL